MNSEILYQYTDINPKPIAPANTRTNPVQNPVQRLIVRRRRDVKRR